MKLNDLPETITRETRRAWRTTEDRLLRERYCLDGPSVCASVLGRGVASVYCRANTLGLKAPSTGRLGRARQRWASSEAIDAAIRTAWLTPKKGFSLLVAEQVGRPTWWVRKRAVDLGLSQLTIKEPEWTREEEELIVSSSHMSLDVIVRRLKAAGYTRTPTAVRVRLKRIGVSIRQARIDEGKLSAAHLARLLGVDSKTVLRFIEREGLPAKRRGTQRGDAQGGDEYEIESKNLRPWIAKHASLIDLRKVEKYWFVELAFPGHS